MSDEETIKGERIGFMDLDEDDGALGIGLAAFDESGYLIPGPADRGPGRYILVRRERTDEEEAAIEGLREPLESDTEEDA